MHQRLKMMASCREYSYQPAREETIYPQQLAHNQRRAGVAPTPRLETQSQSRSDQGSSSFKHSMGPPPPPIPSQHHEDRALHHTRQSQNGMAFRADSLLTHLLHIV